jgi:hypothetical protein
MLSRQLWLPIVVATALITETSALHASQIIYDNTSSSPTGQGGTITALEQGDEVRLNPDAPRSIVLLEIGLNQQGTAGTTDLLARLYANDGPSGEPGTLLWQSDLFRDISLTGGNDLISLDVPNVTVPDVFTWTIQVSNSTPVAVALPFFGEPSVGTSPAYVWFGGPGSWGHPSVPVPGPLNYLARISVPGPLPLFGVGVAFGYSRKLRKRIKSSPFPFDVHVIIYTQDAPALENAIHNEIQNHRLNKINVKREFFSISHDQLKAAIDRAAGETNIEYRAHWTKYAEAEQYRQSLREAS